MLTPAWTQPNSHLVSPNPTSNKDRLPLYRSPLQISQLVQSPDEHSCKFDSTTSSRSLSRKISFMDLHKGSRKGARSLNASEISKNVSIATQKDDSSIIHSEILKLQASAESYKRQRDHLLKKLSRQRTRFQNRIESQNEVSMRLSNHLKERIAGLESGSSLWSVRDSGYDSILSGMSLQELGMRESLFNKGGQPKDHHNINHIGGSGRLIESHFGPRAKDSYFNRSNKHANDQHPKLGNIRGSALMEREEHERPGLNDSLPFSNNYASVLTHLSQIAPQPDDSAQILFSICVDVLSQQYSGNQPNRNNPHLGHSIDSQPSPNGRFCDNTKKGDNSNDFGRCLPLTPMRDLLWLRKIFE